MLKPEQRLSELRAERGLSQEALAEAVNVSRQTISKWEHGTVRPSAENLAKLSEVFQVPVDALLKEDWTPPEEAAPVIQVVEVPVPVKVPVFRPKRRLLALLAALILGAGILVGALLFREKPAKDTLTTHMDTELFDDTTLGEPLDLLPPWETDS